MNKPINNAKDESIKIECLSHDGRGIAVIKHKKTFVAGALPNELITCKITRQSSHFNEATVAHVLTPAPSRVSPPCEHFGICGGCNLQHMDSAMQLEMKQQTLLEQLQHFGQVRPKDILPPLHAHDLGYRRKARLGVKYVIKKGKVLVGFREKAKHYLADLKQCVVLHDRVGKELLTLAEFIAKLKCYQHIPQIEVAIGDTEVALVFRHMIELSEEDRAAFVDFGKTHDFHIYLQPNPPGTITKLYPEGSDFIHYTLPDYDVDFAFHPLDFTQVNLDINRLMVKQAITFLDLHHDETVLDLFCGIGNFTLPIAKFVQTVTGIEGSETCVARARMNALKNKIDNTTFHAANLMEPKATAEWIRPYDKVLLDPPRAGAKEILPYFKIFAPKRIVYISCNPATLARDAGELVHQQGYALTQAGVMNMFPHTAHIEAMAVFQKT